MNPVRLEPPSSLPEPLVLGDHVRMPRILVRNLRPGESIPFGHGCEHFPALDPHWCWIAIHQQHICGLLIGAALHGTFVVLRIVVPPNSPQTTALVLLRQVRRVVLSRGIKAWITFLVPLPTVPAEEKLLRIAGHFNAQVIPICGAWVIGRV